MIDRNYSIDEIENKRKQKKNKISFLPSTKKDYSEVPKNTLKLIEEAEETK